MKYINRTFIYLFLFGLYGCQTQENTVQNPYPVLGPPTIPDGEYWYKLGEVDKDTISVLYACRSGQIGLHSELTIKKTDINERMLISQ